MSKRAVRSRGNRAKIFPSPQGSGDIRFHTHENSTTLSSMSVGSRHPQPRPGFTAYYNCAQWYPGAIAYDQFSQTAAITLKAASQY